MCVLVLLLYTLHCSLVLTSTGSHTHVDRLHGDWKRWPEHIKYFVGQTQAEREEKRCEFDYEIHCSNFEGMCSHRWIGAEWRLICAFRWWSLLIDLNDVRQQRAIAICIDIVCPSVTIILLTSTPAMSMLCEQRQCLHLGAFCFASTLTSISVHIRLIHSSCAQSTVTCGPDTCSQILCRRITLMTHQLHIISMRSSPHSGSSTVVDVPYSMPTQPYTCVQYNLRLKAPTVALVPHSAS